MISNVITSDEGRGFFVEQTQHSITQRTMKPTKRLLAFAICATALFFSAPTKPALRICRVGRGNPTRLAPPAYISICPRPPILREW